MKHRLNDLTNLLHRRVESASAKQPDLMHDELAALVKCDKHTLQNISFAIPDKPVHSARRDSQVCRCCLVSLRYAVIPSFTSSRLELRPTQGSSLLFFKGDSTWH